MYAAKIAQKNAEEWFYFYERAMDRKDYEDAVYCQTKARACYYNARLAMGVEEL